MSIPTSCQTATSSVADPAADHRFHTARPTVAVVPAAGWGTRLRPLTDAIPKEMLPVGRCVALERIVNELRAAGMKRIVFVLSARKEPLIRGYFGDSRDDVEFCYALQPEMRGLGDAVLCGAPFCPPGSPIVIALGDAVYEEATPGAITKRLVTSFADIPDATVGVVVQRLPRERLSRYGVVKPLSSSAVSSRMGSSQSGTDSEYFLIDDIVEKPSADEAPSNFAVAARFLVQPAVFEILRETPPGKGGEIQLTDALRAPLNRGSHGVAVPLIEGEVRHDIGALDSYFKAFAAFALSDVEQGEEFRAYVRQRLTESRKDASQ